MHKPRAPTPDPDSIEYQIKTTNGQIMEIVDEVGMKIKDSIQLKA